MNTILKVLLEVTIYSSVIAGILLILRALFKKKISAKLQYMAWLLLIVRLMVPVTVESGVHFFTIKEEPAVIETATQETHAESKPVAEAPAQSAPQTAPMVSQNTAPQAKPQMNAAPAETAKKLAIHVTWQQVVIGLWMMGMIALGVFFIRARVRFMKKMNLTMPTDEMRMEYDRICEEMMLREAPELCVCEVPSPALMGRRILLPEGLSGQTLRYALYHELTHYRRKDHIMVVLMSALRCVYWFNPLVWAAFKAMQEDMEVACDAGVLQLIGTEEKGGYLMTLLKMFSSHTTPAIGMAQAESKRAAKARIEGAFRKRRTGRAMRMVSAIAACMILVCCFTTACQPTPEVQPLQSKGQLQEKIEESEEVKVYEETLPHINSLKEFDNGHKYEIDADIIGQDAENIPIYDIEFVPFEDGEVLEKRIEAAFPGYAFIEDALTKEHYAQMLTRYQSYLTSLKNGIHPETGEKVSADEIENLSLGVPCAKKYSIVKPGEEEDHFASYTKIDNLEALMEETMAEMQQAPSAAELGETDFIFDDDGERAVAFNIINDKETLSTVVQNGWTSNVLWAENMTLRETEKDGGYIDYPDKASSPEDFAENEEFQEVKVMADEILGNLEAQDLILTAVRAVEKKNAFTLTYTQKLGTGELKEIIPQWYYSTIQDTDIQGYIDLWASQTCTFEFHNGQLYELFWRNPVAATKTVDNAKVLPWEEILRIAEQQLEYIVVPSEGKHDTSTPYGPYKDIVIDRIELGYTKMLVKDTKDQYQLIPTWSFFGHNRYMNHQEICFVTVNAVDGTIMEHRLGY